MPGLFLYAWAGPFAGEPAPTATCAQPPSWVQPLMRFLLRVGAGLPANTVAAATVNGRWRLASRAGPFAGKPAPTGGRGCYLNRLSTPFSTRILAEISSTEKCVELILGMFSLRNRLSTSRTSNSHWAKLE